MEFRELEKHVIRWADDKGILENATPLTQINKTLEEVNETKFALVAQSINHNSYTNKKGLIVNTKDEIIDGFGDVLVTVLIGCKMQGLDPLDCLETAYNVIAKRSGRIINGTFVKDE